MLNLISCELLKLKRSKMVLISVAGVLSTPLLMLIEALQTHFDKPEIIFTLSDIYSDSVLYSMLLVNIMIYVAIAAYLFSREYTESTLKTILPIPISRTKLLIGKFCTLLLWIVMLTLVTWAGIFIVCGLYDAVFTLEGYSLLVAIVWLPKFLFGSILMFLTVSPFVFVAMKTKGFVAPMIGSAVIVMGSAALSNQEYIEYLLDLLLSDSIEERAFVVAEYGKEVRKIEQRISEFIASHPAGCDERSRSHSAGTER